MLRQIAVLLILLSFLSLLPMFGQINSDMYAAVKQSAVDKVVHDAQYPITLIDQWWPFSGDIRSTADRIVSGTEGAKYLATAKTLDCSKQPKSLACGILRAYTDRDLEIETVRQKKDQALKSGSGWKGPDDASLDAMKRQQLDFKVHLAHLKINLLKAPNITISGIATGVKNVSLDIDAVGELWVNHPAWNCTSYCSVGPIVLCCGGHWDTVWEKALEVDVSDVKITADGTVTFSVNGMLVNGTPSLQNLALDYDILRDINLAPIANAVLNGESFMIIDASKIVAAVPYVNNKYTISGIVLSGNSEIRADITIQKLP